MEACSYKNNVKSADNVVSKILSFKENFNQNVFEYDRQHQGSFRKPWTLERILDVIKEIKNPRVTMSSGLRKTAMEYYWNRKYDILSTASEDYLIFKRLNPTAPTVRILPRENYFDVLSEIHKSCGHGGRDKMLYELKDKYYIPKKAVEIYVPLCPTCESKRKYIATKPIKPIISHKFNIRGQVDLMDFQSCPDGEFKWLLSYQDNGTKFLNLRPLKTKQPVEVASELMKIFLIFGAPNILQSDNGREFTASIIKELFAMWPVCKIDHGSPRRSRTKGERDNRGVENMLRAWMNENKSTNWSIGCFFMQYFQNSSFHRIIGQSPYKALFGIEPKASLMGTNILASILSTTETDEQLILKTGQEAEEQSTVERGQGIEDSLMVTKELEIEKPLISKSELETEEQLIIKTEQEIEEKFKVKTEEGETEEQLIVKTEIETEEQLFVKTEIKTEEELIVKTNQDEATCSFSNNNDNNLKTEMDNIESLASNFTCVICHNEVISPHTCQSCNRYVHATCGITVNKEGQGSNVVCYICKVEEDINIEMENKSKGLKRAAEEMNENTNKRMPYSDTNYAEEILDTPISIRKAVVS